MKKALFLILATIFSISLTQATTKIVTNHNDSGPGSLRGVIATASNNDTIIFNLPAPDTIKLVSGPITINNFIHISGPGASNLAIDGNNNSQIFNPAANFELSGLTLQNALSNSGGGLFYIGSSQQVIATNCTFKGNHSTTIGGAFHNMGILKLFSCNIIGNNSNGIGGAIYNYGNLTITDCIISSNISGADGGAIYGETGSTTIIDGSSISSNSSQAKGGAVFSSSTLKINNSTLLNNNSSSDGGGIYGGGPTVLKNSSIIYNNSSGKGGGIHNGTSSPNITNCIISGNVSTYDGGGIYSNSNLNLSKSTVTNNSSSSNGGGIFTANSNANISASTISGNTAGIFGGGFYCNGGNTYLTNCTISGNTSSSGGGLGLFALGSTLELFNCTVANNGVGESGQGNGIFVIDTLSSSINITLTNTIFSNAGSNIASDGTYFITSNGHNICSDNTMATSLNNTGDMNNTNPMLDVLANNGGSTQTHALLCGSPAINAGTSAGAPINDQRDSARVGNVDIGAFEVTIANYFPTTSLTTIVNCGDYTWNGNTYTTTGIYTDTIPNLAGCDSIMTLDLTINNTTSFQSATVCSSYLWNGTNYTTSGVYVDTIPNAIGCDSIMTLNLTIVNYPVVTTNVNSTTITADEIGASYQWIDCDNGNTAIAGETNQSFTATANGNYAVIINNGSCSDTSACVSITTVGINSYSYNSEYKIWPNPSNGIFTVEAKDEINSIVISNSLGQTVFTSTNKTNRQLIDLSKEAKGVYYLEYKTDKNTFAKKLFIQ